MQIYYENFDGREIEQAAFTKIPLWPKDSRIDHDVAEDPYPPAGRIQRLLLTEEYKDFQENIVVEDQFIELDKCGDPIRAVLVGLSRKSVIVAVDQIPDLRISRSSLRPDRCADEEELELDWMSPLFLVSISMILDEEVLNIRTIVGHRRHFLLSNTRGGGDRDLNWLKWIISVEEMNQDQDGYLKEMWGKWHIYPDDVNFEQSRPNLSVTRSVGRSLEKIHSKLFDSLDRTLSRHQGSSAQLRRNTHPFLVPLELFDTSGIVPSESRSNTGCFACFQRRRKHHRKKKK